MALPRIKKYVFPKRIGTCVDKLDTLRAARSAHVKAALTIEEKMKAEEKALVEHMQTLFKKEGIEGADGKNKHAKVNTDEIPTVDNWEKLYAYIKRTGSFDLLQKRLSTTAVNERRAAKKVIPGTGTFNKVTISLVKK